MTEYTLKLSRETLHGRLGKKLKPALVINSGDSVVFQTVEGDWRWERPAQPCSESGVAFVKRVLPEDQGHGLTGPVFINGAKPGTVLKVHVDEIIPWTWGWSRTGDGDPDHMRRIGFEGSENFLLWDLNAEKHICISNRGHRVPMDPFMGVMAVAPETDGWVRTHIPGIHGGNLDCRDIIAGSTLYMPVYTDGALFSTGDGHARQGDGELGCTAIECPMRSVRMTFETTNEPFKQLLCNSPRGWITFGFHEDLTEAAYQALLNMADFISERFHCDKKEALNLCGPCVDMHVTQIVNGIRGAHAVLPHGVLTAGSETLE